MRLKLLLVLFLLLVFSRYLLPAQPLEQQESILWTKVDLSLQNLEHERNLLENSVVTLRAQLETSNRVSVQQEAALSLLDNQLKTTEDSVKKLSADYNELKLKTKRQTKLILTLAVIGVIMLLAKAVLLYSYFVTKAKFPRFLEILL